MKTYFTSDTHFGHKNIIKYCNRPFDDIDHHDSTLINNWNETVGPNDIVYHLGDFCLGHPDKAVGYLKRLNGSVHFIKGNHDKSAFKIRNEFASFKMFDEIKVNGQSITLCHYAMRVWNKSHHGAWHLYGHSHGTLPDDPNSLSFDVGVDCHNYRPISFEEVGKIMSKKTWKPIDHHGHS